MNRVLYQPSHTETYHFVVEDFFIDSSPLEYLINLLHSREFFKYWVEIVDMVIIVLALITTIVNEVILTDEKSHPNAGYAK